MVLVALVVAGTLLSLERVCYIGITRAPGAFRRWCARPRVAWFGEPVAIVQRLFIAFKALQLLVFAGWCWAFDDDPGGIAHHDTRMLVVVLVVLGTIGQLLVWAVFYRLGKIGVFYGDWLGHDVPWCSGFPFSVLAHPQYVGTVLTIWAFFLATRFPSRDWYLLPLLETAYYIAGALFEGSPPRTEAAEESTRYRPADGNGGPYGRGAMARHDGGSGRGARRRRVEGGKGAATLSHDLG